MNAVKNNGQAQQKKQAVILPADLQIVQHTEGGWQLHFSEKTRDKTAGKLTGKHISKLVPLKTPAGHDVQVASLAMAQAIQQEARDNQHGKKPTYVIFPRLCHVLDHVLLAKNPQQAQAAMRDKILSYANHDLLCYRVEHPPELMALEQEKWQKWLDWAREQHQIELAVTDSVMHIPQDAAALQKITEYVAQKNITQQVSFLELTEILGSVILAMASVQADDGSEETYQEILNASSLHEYYQAEKWGITDEHRYNQATHRQELRDALRFYELSV